MTFDPTEPTTWPEELRQELRGMDPDELRKLADAMVCAVMALDEGAVGSRISLEIDPRVARWAMKMVAAIREQDDPTGR